MTVLMTAPGTESAEAVTRALVEERLAACGNIIPGAVSVYRWKGEICRDEEVVVVLKTTRGLLPRVLERAAELHPYYREMYLRAAARDVGLHRWAGPISR